MRLGVVCLPVSLVIVDALGLGACSRESSEQGGPPPAVPVTVATFAQKPRPVEQQAIGNVQPSQSVTVRARVGGILASVHFREGEDVPEGQRLFTLDRGPLEAALREARAALERSRAQLEILAPMSSRTGSYLVHPGDLIKINDTPLVVINQLRPVDVAFALPEGELPAIRRYRAEGPSSSPQWRPRAASRSRPASSASSTTASIRRPAPSRSRPPSPTRTAGSGPACSSTWCSPSPRSPTRSWCRPPRCRPASGGRTSSS
jgi:multidrug efflux pump subunit AcrA (membrane-fusion protein)